MVIRRGKNYFHTAFYNLNFRNTTWIKKKQKNEIKMRKKYDMLTAEIGLKWMKEIKTVAKTNAYRKRMRTNEKKGDSIFLLLQSQYL